MSQLPRYYETIRGHLCSALAALETYERVFIAKAWGCDTKLKPAVRALEAMEAQAVHDVESRLVQLCDFVGVRSRQLEGLLDKIAALQERNAWLEADNHRLTQMNMQLLERGNAA